MGAFRKAGVWLGLVEEEDEHDPGGYDDEYVEEEFTPVRPRSAARAPSRFDRESPRPVDDRSRYEEPARTERGSVRPLTRSNSAPATVNTVSSVSFPSHDNLALAPQTQLRERAVIPDEPAKRYQITTLHPTNYFEARAIGEHFREGVPVIINLTDMEESDARRLVDFAAGLAFGLRGTIERVTNRVFLISPANIQVTAEDKAKIAEGGFFDQS
jgi:cell division inhibitor SepF